MKNQRVVFTHQRLAKLTAPPGQRVVLYDAKTPHLMIRVGSRDKTFYWYAKVDGKPERVPLGTFPDLPLAAARVAANRFTGERAQGINPAAERKQRRTVPTFGQLWEHWLSHAEQRKAASSLAQDKRYYERFLEPWAKRRLDTITKAEVSALHTKVGTENGRYLANRMLALLRSMLNRADDIGYNGINPAAKIPLFKEVKRDRFLHGDELRAFFQAVAAEDGIYQDVLVLLLLTGARRSNLVAMQWQDIDFDHAIWRIPKAKAGVPIVVPLVPAALQILLRRHAERTDSPFVFPGRGKAGHLESPRAPWERVITRAGLKDVRLHDLRRSLGSWQAIGGSSLPTIGASLGHTQPSTTAIYARLSLGAVRKSVENATDAMLAAGGDEAKRLLEGPK